MSDLFRFGSKDSACWDKPRHRNSFSNVLNLDAKVLEIGGKIGAHLLQLIKVHWFVTFDSFNDTTPSRLRIL